MLMFSIMDIKKLYSQLISECPIISDIVEIIVCVLVLAFTLFIWYELNKRRGRFRGKW